MRLKEHSEIEIKGFESYEGKSRPKILLVSGSLLAATESAKDGVLIQIQTSGPRIVPAQAMFQVRADENANHVWVGVLGGHVAVKLDRLWERKVYELEDLEKLELRDRHQLTPPAQISTGEWNELREAYELFQKSSVFYMEQFDLARRTGNLFYYVFDHGTFYSPEAGYANREFIVDESEEKTFLEAHYDVFLSGVLVGVYFKTRDFDFSKFRALEFEVKRTPAKPFPDLFRIELKSKEGTVQAFSQRDFEPDWKKVTLSFRASKPVSISELTFVFTHEGVGIYKKGALQFRNFNLLPALVLTDQKPNLPNMEVSTS